MFMSLQDHFDDAIECYARRFNVVEDYNFIRYSGMNGAQCSLAWKLRKGT